ncbi:MAG: hypothetical protein JXQ25_06055 [Deltaproteobacteria bacterium]|nr:hypothetical protein [Deltaproteobacteria bacterium]
MKAEEKWSVKAKNKRLPDLQIILAALDKQKRWHENPTKGEFIPPWKHPPTWIYNECWNDEVPDRTTITSQEDPFAFCPNCKKEVEKSSIVDGKCNHCTDRGEIPKEIRELTRGIG